MGKVRIIPAHQQKGNSVQPQQSRQPFEQLRVAAYCRVSTDYDEQASSYETQVVHYKELIQKFSDLINSDGKVEEVNEMGKRKLAYEIKKNKEAYYVAINFEANPSLIKELERVYRITDEVIKFIVIRKDEE